MKILTVSDKPDDLVYSPNIRKRFGDVDLVLSCGDLPFNYLEYIVSMLRTKRLYYVCGNHQCKTIKRSGEIKVAPEGCENIHGRVVNHKGLLIGGLEGSIRYSGDSHQYTELQMHWNVWKMAPRLYWNRLRYGRAIDILITHAPPRGIGDADDLCHRGFRAFLKFMDMYSPRYLIHGHVHLYRRNAQRRRQYRETTVINTYGHQVIEIDEDELKGRGSQGDKGVFSRVLGRSSGRGATRAREDIRQG
ncbi:MAG: metallophosphoesterase [Chloroflexota bacterium]|nr:metallophosphoesterase [Chloroflexota bacterium]